MPSDDLVDARDHVAQRIATFLLDDTPYATTPEFTDTQVKRFLAAYYRHQTHTLINRLQNLDYCDTLPLDTHMARFYTKAATRQHSFQDPLAQTFNFTEPLIDAPWVDWSGLEE